MKTKLMIALSALAITTAPCMANTIECEVSREAIEEGALAEKVRIDFSNDEFSRTLTATVISPEREDVYKKARAHSGGGSYTTLDGREVKYYNRDYCADYTYRTEREGPFWDRRTVVTGFRCDVGSDDITIEEIFPQDRSENEPFMYVRSVRVKDFDSDILGDGWIKFDNCAEI